jgi:hypothetical protein
MLDLRRPWPLLLLLGHGASDATASLPMAMVGCLQASSVPPRHALCRPLIRPCACRRVGKPAAAALAVTAGCGRLASAVVASPCRPVRACRSWWSGHWLVRYRRTMIRSGGRVCRWCCYCYGCRGWPSPVNIHWVKTLPGSSRLAAVAHSTDLLEGVVIVPVYRGRLGRKTYSCASISDVGVSCEHTPGENPPRFIWAGGGGTFHRPS